MRISLTLLLAVSIAAVSTLSGADWPQWRGPDRSAVSKETGLLKTWPKAGPKLLWTFDKAGNGYSPVAVVGGIAYTGGARGDDEYVLALDANGKELWATKIGPTYDFDANTWVHGPNGSPCVDGDLVFLLGSKGILVCVEKANGKLVWSKDLPKDLGGLVSDAGSGPRNFGWGYTWSPLVDGDKLVIVPGGPQGLFAALDKKTGNVLWRSKAVTDLATYSSPLVATIGGVKQYLYLVQDGVVAVSAENGDLLWRYKRDAAFPDVVCPTPIVSGDNVYVSVGWNGGSELLKVTNVENKFSVKSEYQNNNLGNRQGGVVKVGDTVYGFHEVRQWVAQDFASGAVKWKSKFGGDNLTAGGVISADGLLFILDEKGTVAALQASPKAYKEVGRFSLPQKSGTGKPSGKIWTHPVLSDGKLYLRDQELIFCYEVK
jgi:outer membrane protein assembly factor BamB